MAIYEPKIDFNGEIVLPDSWNSQFGLVPSDSFVVSRHRDGKVASTYGDLSWDRTPYEPSGRTCWLHFDFWDSNDPTEHQLELAKELRYMMFLLLWKRPGAPLANSSCKGYLLALRSVAEYADNSKCYVRDVFNSTDLLLGFVGENISGGKLKLISSLHRAIVVIGESETGFPVLGTSFQDLFSPVIARYMDSMKQYAPLPTRIYSTYIGTLLKIINDWEEIECRYFDLVSECLNNPLLGKFKNHQIKLSGVLNIERVPGQFEPEFVELLEKHGLTDYFKKTGLTADTRGLSRGLSLMQSVAKLCVVTFTGMRNAEAANLPYYCFDVEEGVGGQIHYIVQGRTTKLKKTRTKWVTNAEGVSAIKLAQRIADLIYRKLGDLPKRNNAKLNKYPLFVSPTYLGFTGAFPQGAKNIWHTKKFNNLGKDCSEFKDVLFPIIEDGDLHELEQIDLHRAWRSEAKFQIGKPWPLTEHQLRRSLALYAQRSGLVSLSSLRRQLQHITQEMSRYYAKGSVLAKNFIGDDDDHFGHDWQDAAPISSALAYIRDVLVANEPIFGGHTKWIQHRLGNAEGAVLFDRASTMKRFLKGEIAYKETPIGGCTKVGPCDELALRFLDVDCLSGCENLVGKLSKLDRVISAQTALVGKLNQNSIEWRMENSDLEVLVATRAKIFQSQVGE